MLTLKGRTCMFAGASGAVGSGAVRELAKGGMNVVMVSHMLEDAAALAEELKDAPGKVEVMSNKATKPDICRAIVEKYGSLDVIISNTGALFAPCPIEECSVDDFKEKLLNHALEPFTDMQAALPYLRQSKAGRVILMTTAGGRMGFAGENIMDSVARGAVMSLTYAMATQLAGDHITVNCIAKSGMVNDHAPATSKNFDVAAIAGEIPLGHVGTPEEFGSLVAYVASEEASYTTGHVFNLSGGIYMG